MFREGMTVWWRKDARVLLMAQITDVMPDNSCGDPDCCGAPGPDYYTITVNGAEHFVAEYDIEMLAPGIIGV